MDKKKKKLLENIILFSIYGILYGITELLYRGYTHWTMLVLGGICGVAIGAINEYFSWDMSLLLQATIGAGITTSLEFVFGVVLNIWLKLGIWDYSNLPFNILGQVCLPFTIVWFFLSLIVIILDDFLRWKLFGEEKPHYSL